MGEATEPFVLVPPHQGRFDAYLNLINTESDRGVVLVSASILDELLRQSLLARFVDDGRVGALMDGFNAPLGTFSSRVLAAFATGVIRREEFEEIGILRKVRNAFAHELTASFEDQSIRDLCANLKLPRHETTPRGRFTISAIISAQSLVNRAFVVAGHRLEYGGFQPRVIDRSGVLIEGGANSNPFARSSANAGPDPA